MAERLTGEERRRVIVEAAVALFSQKGFRGTTTKEIAETAGCSEATIFKHFSTKGKLYSAMLEAKSRIDETLAKAAHAAASKDDIGVFRAVGLESLIRTEQDPSLMRLLLFSALEGHELSHLFFESKVRGLHEFLSSYIKGRIGDGAFQPVDPLLAARGFVGMIAHYLLIHEIFGVKRQAGLLPEHVVDTFVRLFLQGIQR
jgi:TetR/AcrR family transcriptional regulator